LLHIEILVYSGHAFHGVTLDAHFSSDGTVANNLVFSVLQFLDERSPGFAAAFSVHHLQGTRSVICLILRWNLNNIFHASLDLAD